MAVPNWKLPWIVETSGAVIVGEESCVGERGTRNLVDSSGNTLDELMEAIVDRYFDIDCAVFTPNSDRLDHIMEMADSYKADGVIQYGLQFCSLIRLNPAGWKRNCRRKKFPPSGLKPITVRQISANSKPG